MKYLSRLELLKHGGRRGSVQFGFPRFETLPDLRFLPGQNFPPTLHIAAIISQKSLLAGSGGKDIPRCFALASKCHQAVSADDASGDAAGFGR